MKKIGISFWVCALKYLTNYEQIMPINPSILDSVKDNIEDKVHEMSDDLIDYNRVLVDLKII